MGKIKNTLYKQFLEEGLIDTLEEDHIKQALDIINNTNFRKGKSKEEAAALLLTLYYTGARPAEVLEIKAKNITKKGVYVIIQVPAKKRGLPRPIYLSYKNHYVKKIFDFAIKVYPDMLLFRNFRTKYTRRIKKIKKVEGFPIKEITTFRVEYTDGLRYYFKKWFSFLIEGGIPPYFLRHNRFSRLSEDGASAEEIRIIKGSRRLESVTPYIHLSSNTAKKLAKKIK